MAHSTSDMRLSGGNPALDFVNTVDSRRDRWGPDFLRSFEDLLVLAERTEVLDVSTASSLRQIARKHPDAANAAVAGAVSLREAIHRLFFAETTDEDYPREALEAVEAAARVARARSRLQVTKGGFTWAQPFDELDDVGRAFGILATELLTSRADRREVRECKGDNCGWLFLDHSKGGRRMWCSEAGCGTRSRVARFRNRLEEG